MPFRRFLHQLLLYSETGRARVVRHRCRAIAMSILILGSVQLSAASSQPLDSNSTIAEEPITPIPGPRPIDPRKVKLGERLFGDPRLSRDNSRSCLSCHDISTNGATTKRQDVGLDGSSLPFNTLTIFNATLNFRLGWEG
jgi:cytochrome c peroxidase